MHQISALCNIKSNAEYRFLQVEHGDMFQWINTSIESMDKTLAALDKLPCVVTVWVLIFKFFPLYIHFVENVLWGKTPFSKRIHKKITLLKLNNLIIISVFLICLS